MGGTQKKKKSGENDKFRKNAITVLIVIAVILALSIGIKTNVLYTGFAAVKVGNVSYSAADYNFQFYSAYYQTYSNMQNYYGEMASSILDPKKPLDQQKYSDTQTWADHFKETAINNLQQIAILCNAANSANYKLPDEAKNSVDSTIDGYKQTYKNSGYATLDAFLEMNFGKGMTEKLFRKNLENQLLAGYYYKQLYESKNYTTEELDAYYNLNRDKLDAITYRQYFVSGAPDESKGIDAEKAMENAKATAEKIAAARSEAEFSALVYEAAPQDSKEKYKDADSTLLKNQKVASLYSGSKDWLVDGKRSKGDTTVVKGEGGYYALYFVSRSDNSYNTKKVRHILIKVDDFSDSAKTEESLKKAQDLLNQWKNGDKTEASFAKLATENSADPGSQGGYYDVYRGQMVKEFEDWCFDAGRKAGDTGIIKTDYGYHIMYFVGEGELYRQTLARDEKKLEDYNSWYESQKKAFPVSETFFMRYTKKS